MAVVTQNSVVSSFLPESNTSKTIARVDGPQELGKDAFLKLLVTQMKYQDPLNPLEGIEFTAQLAQFSQLEQLFSLNEEFSTVNTNLQSQSTLQTVSLLGKEVKAASEALSVTNGQASQGTFSIEEAASSVIVSIYDESGTKVRTLDLGPSAAGDYNIDWDGRNARGATVPDGEYVFQVLASGADGESVEASSSVTGRITGMTFDANGLPVMLMNGVEISLSQIMEIQGITTASEQ